MELFIYFLIININIKKINSKFSKLKNKKIMMFIPIKIIIPYI